MALLFGGTLIVDDDQFHPEIGLFHILNEQGSQTLSQHHGAASRTYVSQSVMTSTEINAFSDLTGAR